jgi:K+-sensing histidine kinase KdpD
MKPSLLLVAGNNERFTAVAIEAANEAFRGATVASAHSLEEALAMETASTPEILLLADAGRSMVRAAAEAVDAGKLPRWSVVAMGTGEAIPFTETIPESEWSPALLARVLRSSVALHLLHRERERLRGDLLSIGIRISHDLRTPVGGILSATEVVEGSMPAGVPPGESLTQPIIESANDLAKIIGQLTLLSKASARPESRQLFNMAVPVGRALERVEMRVRGKGAKVANAASWPDANADPALTEAIWVCLLDNAIRHSGKAPNIELGWEKADGGNKYWVRDNGPGIAREKRKLLFHPFHRLHEPSAPRGLGLSTVERLVAIQGGRCGYECVEPSGSAFCFSLPE